MENFSLYSKYPISVLKGDYFNSRNLDVQRSIYIADILSKHFVCSPSFLYELSFSYLKYLAHLNQVFILDPSQFFYINGIPQFGF